jgi:hypothetical protein
MLIAQQYVPPSYQKLFTLANICGFGGLSISMHYTAVEGFFIAVRRILTNRI